MTEKGQINPAYKALAQVGDQRDSPDQKARASRATSVSQAEELEMESGAHWSLEATKGDYESGGNEGDWRKGYHPDDQVVGPDPEP